MRIRQGYEDAAAAYLETFRSELAGKPFDRLLLDRFAHLTRGGRICELGSGPAQTSSYVLARPAELRPRVALALDFALAMLRQARVLVPRIPALQADMAALPFPDGAFDGLLAFYAIVHLEAAALAPLFAEWMRALRPGGWLLVAFHCGSQRLCVREFLGKPVEMEWIPADPDAVLGELDRLGFRREACVVRYPYPGAEHPSKRAYFLVQKPGP